jgi:hypothetical protein
MPTRKQRRRREKGQRHEYEYVLLDEEGNEVEVDPTELRKEKEGERGSKPAANGKAPPQKRDAKGRRIREVPPPSWNRAVKRALPWAAALAAIVIWTGSRSKNHAGLASAIVLGVLYAIAFVPMMYFIDRMAYRRYLRARGASPAESKKPRR